MVDDGRSIDSMLLDGAKIVSWETTANTYIREMASGGVESECPAVVQLRESLGELVRYVRKYGGNAYFPPEVLDRTVVRAKDILTARIFDEVYPASMRPHRTLVRVLSVGQKSASVKIHGWEGDHVPLQLDRVPEEMLPKLAIDYEFYAQVNVDAEKAEDLYFRNFDDE